MHRDLTQFGLLAPSNRTRVSPTLVFIMTDFCSFHLEVSHCGTARAHSSRTTVTNLYLKSVEGRTSCLSGVKLWNPAWLWKGLRYTDSFILILFCFIQCKLYQFKRVILDDRTMHNKFTSVIISYINRGYPLLLPPPTPGLCECRNFAQETLSPPPLSPILARGL